MRDSIIRSMLTYLDLEQQTVLMSTHEVSEAEPVLDMVVAVQGGQICGLDEVDNIRGRHGLSLVEWMKETMTK